MKTVTLSAGKVTAGLEEGNGSLSPGMTEKSPVHRNQLRVQCSVKSLENFTFQIKAKGVRTCYIIAYMSQTRDQQYFSTSELAADWHVLMVFKRTMLTVDTLSNFAVKTV